MTLPEKDIDDLPKNEANYTALTPLWFLKRAALVHPNRRSVVHGSVHYTWLQTYRRCCRLASALSKLSVGFGSTVTRSLSSFFFFNFFVFVSLVGPYG
ncbi:putative acid--thiol ligase [Helianthus anomalus]